LAEELDKLGWTDAELTGRLKSDARKPAMARRLRTETTVTLKRIAGELHMGRWTHVSNLLALAQQPGSTSQSELNSCQK
jgi:hypothetical protein